MLFFKNFQNFKNNKILRNKEGITTYLISYMLIIYSAVYWVIAVSCDQYFTTTQ